MELYKQPKMVRWYNPKQLSATGMKALLSGTFASYADKREMQAALDPNRRHYDAFDEDAQELWIDFVSDTGDGFNPTYTIADLVAQQLAVAYTDENGQTVSQKLESGQVLVLGGDQVYPTPSMDEYENKFKIPFEAASVKHHKTNDAKKMFVIPGNHDWYDGLGNFIKLFCQKRKIGNWQTCQRRSYFAVQLVQGYWLWGIDVQLNSDIDQPQKDYFEEIATKKMNNGDKIILCTSEPAWVYKQIHRKDSSYSKLKFFEEMFITDGVLDEHTKFRLVATITGDLHHYSRYVEYKKDGDNKEYKNHLITAGGGGAFLHPTHNLPTTLTQFNVPKNPKLEKCFPEPSVSRRMANRVLLFPLKNYDFWLSMGVIQLLLAWILLDGTTGILDFMLRPSVLILILAICFGMYKFCDYDSGKRDYGWLGVVHGLFQSANLFGGMVTFYHVNVHCWHITNPYFYLLAFVLEVAFMSLIGSFMMGFYLWFTNRVLGIHINESFSSLACEDYKNFLRMHIAVDGSLTIYPIGVKTVPKDWKQNGTGAEMTFTSQAPIEYELIEPPITIN